MLKEQVVEPVAERSRHGRKLPPPYRVRDDDGDATAPALAGRDAATHLALPLAAASTPTHAAARMRQPTPEQSNASPEDAAPPGPSGGRVRRVGLALGVVAGAVMLLLAPPAGMSGPAWRTAAVAALMAVWWVTEAIPIAATALVPLVLFPLLGVAAIGDAAAPYANPVVFLFLGGFLIAGALQRAGLHRRLALALIAAVGTRPDRLVLGFLTTAAAISMWVSNTATVVMLLPLAAPVVALVTARGRGDGAAEPAFEVPLLLSLAYGASLGGLGTLIGTPPNALLAGFMAEAHGMRIGFGRWMLIGVPLAVVSVPITWLLLTRVSFRVGRAAVPGVAESVAAQRRALGPPSRGELLVGAVAGLTALSWVFQPLLERLVPGVSDAGIAVAAALLLFVVPIGGGRAALDWRTAEGLPWGVLVLFGGGLSLAAAIQRSGLAAWIGGALGALGTLPLPLVVLLVIAVVVFSGELTSNTASAAALLPLVSSLAVGVGADPLLLTVPTALAASCGFMLPVGTPPNAIVFGAGRITIPEMVRAGLVLDVVMIALVWAVSYWFAVPALRG